MRQKKTSLIQSVAVRWECLRVILLKPAYVGIISVNKLFITLTYPSTEEF